MSLRINVAGVHGIAVEFALDDDLRGRGGEDDEGVGSCGLVMNQNQTAIGRRDALIGPVRIGGQGADRRPIGVNRCIGIIDGRAVKAAVIGNRGDDTGYQIGFCCRPRPFELVLVVGVMTCHTA